jgi:hypothetical protein
MIFLCLVPGLLNGSASRHDRMPIVAQLVREIAQYLLETQEGVHKHGTLFYALAAQTHLLLQKHTPATKASKV